jgi:hypothetical protein
MIVLAANNFFRRLKVANNAFATFDLLKILVNNKLFRISKVANNAFATFDPLKNSFDLMNFRRSNYYCNF